MRTVLVRWSGAVLVPVSVLWLSACGDDAGRAAPAAGVSIVVTTSILGDVVRHLVGDLGTVEVVMPPNADPHDFAPSARQALAMREADALVVNGLGFEAGLSDTIEAAGRDGVPVLVAADAIEPLSLPGGDSPDPHFFGDPARMVRVSRELVEDLAARVGGLDGRALRDHADGYVKDLVAVDRDIEAILAVVPPERRVLLTNHDTLGYFADRYGFEILGAIIPGGSTLAEPNAADLANLARLIAAREVPSIFTDASSPHRLAQALAEEGAHVEVVDLYSESLGEQGSPGATYLGMVAANARRIADALGV